MSDAQSYQDEMYKIKVPYYRAAALADSGCALAVFEQKFGQIQDLPDGVGDATGQEAKAVFAQQATTMARENKLTWQHLLLARVGNIAACTDAQTLYGEIVGTMSLLVGWGSAVLARDAESKRPRDMHYEGLRILAGLADAERLLRDSDDSSTT